MENIIKLIVDIKNERLDKFISNKIDVSRTTIQKLIKNKKVLVDNKIIMMPNFLVSLNSKIIINNEIIYETKLEPIQMNLDIKYEDDDLLIVNKESGVVVHPGAGTKSPTLVNGLLYYLKSNISNNKYNIRPGIVHRLDKDTEGLLIIAKNDSTHIKLQEMISKKEVRRHYRAIVNGIMEYKKGTIDAPIMRDPKYRQKYIVGNHNAKNSITKFETIEIFNNFSVVNIELLTGRTHQIRVHFKYINHPIFNDHVYGKINSKKHTSYGQFLQAYKLSFNHPITNKHIVIEIDMPNEYLEIININKK